MTEAPASAQSQSMPGLYFELYDSCLRRAWATCRKHPWTFAVPPVLLTARAALVTYAGPLQPAGPVLSALGTALLWSLYFVVLKRLSFGWSASWQTAATSLRHRAFDIAELVEPAMTGAVVFLALEFTGCLGVLALSAAALSPVVELLALRGASPTEAIGRGLVFLKDRPFVWSALQLGLMTGAGVLWLIVTAPFALALHFLVSEDLAWLSSLAGALVVGPLLHLLFVFRGVLFLEVERTTHAQRVFRATHA